MTVPLGKYDKRPALLTLLNKKNLIGCEVGVDEGKNAQWMLENLDIRFLYLIDPYCTYDGLKYHGVFETNNEAEEVYQRCLKRLEPFKDKIMIIRDFPENVTGMILDKLDFVYIDSNHRYEYTSKHIELFYPLVRDGGIIAGHDYTDREPGVIQAVNEFFGEGNFQQVEWDFWHTR